MSKKIREIGLKMVLPSRLNLSGIEQPRNARRDRERWIIGLSSSLLVASQKPRPGLGLLMCPPIKTNNRSLFINCMTVKSHNFLFPYKLYEG